MIAAIRAPEAAPTGVIGCGPLRIIRNARDKSRLAALRTEKRVRDERAIAQIGAGGRRVEKVCGIFGQGDVLRPKRSTAPAMPERCCGSFN